MLPSLSMPEMLVIMIFAVVLFGKRLPEVAKSFGKGFVEFKKGLRGIEDELHSVTNPHSYKYLPDHDPEPLGLDPTEPPVAKFEPPVAKFEPPSSSPNGSSNTSANTPPTSTPKPAPEPVVDDPQPYQD
jgi:sec-independent protein translocase protein TatA